MANDTVPMTQILQSYLARYQALDISPSKAAELVRESVNLNDSVTAAAKRLSFDQDPHSYPALLRQLNDER